MKFIKFNFEHEIYSQRYKKGYIYDENKNLVILSNHNFNVEILFSDIIIYHKYLPNESEEQIVEILTFILCKHTIELYNKCLSILVTDEFFINIFWDQYDDSVIDINLFLFDIPKSYETCGFLKTFLLKNNRINTISNKQVIYLSKIAMNKGFIQSFNFLFEYKLSKMDKHELKYLFTDNFISDSYDWGYNAFISQWLKNLNS